MWPCFAQERPDGIGQLAAWLHTAVVKIVTRYTQPGDRVLLLSAPMIVGASPRSDRRISLPEFAGLSEAAWTVARLGRRIRTWTGGPPPADDSAGPPVPSQSESGLRPIADPVGTSTVDRAAPDPGADRFDLIITAVIPHATDWIETVPWTDVLQPSGTLALITHSDFAAGRTLDPTGRLVTTIRDHGLAWLDHVILLKTPIADTASHAASPTRNGPWAPLRHTRVHTDLLLFNAAPTVAGEGGQLG